MFEFWREATATTAPGLLCQSGRRLPENFSILCSLPSKQLLLHTQAAQAQQGRGRDSCLRAVLCCKRIFTSLKACMECKRFFLKERKNVMFLNKIDLYLIALLYSLLFARVSGRLEAFSAGALGSGTTTKNRTRQ